MTFYLPQTSEPPGEPLTEAPPSAGDAFEAAAQAERIRIDSWGKRQWTRRALLDEMQSVAGDSYTAPRFSPALGEDFELRLNDFMQTWPGPDRHAPVPVGANLPRDKDAFEAEVDARLRAEYDEAQEVLGLQPEGAWGAELAGGLWAGASDEATVATLPFGATTGAPLWRIAATEFALGVGSEALTLPRQYRTAEDLDLPQPEAFKQLAIAGVTSAGLGAAISGGLRFREYRQARRTAAGEAAPDGTNAFNQEEAVRAAEDQLLDDAPLKSPVEEKYPAFGAFDFSASGNAAPNTNRVGYVFGKLLELGYEPHIAAGLVGNLVQESGAALHTRAVGDGGNAFGMGQWNGPRMRALNEFARSRGKDPADLDTQIAFLDHELRTSEAPAFDRIRTARDAREAALIASQVFWRPGIPNNPARMANAETVFRQFEGGAVPKWLHAVPSPADDAPRFATTSRGFTREGSVTAGDDFRIDVDYEVVDASILRPASGRFQPRDRSRAASDEQVAEIGARLDPARLMPSPEADRGAPVVGPDDMIESGNGRVQAIVRAAERHPDRYAEYRRQIEEAGYEIPEGVERPVLIARRRTDLDDAGRERFVREANTSAVARMSATERSASDAQAMSPEVIGLYDPSQPIASRANKPFVQRALAAMPQAERNALVDKGGALNAEGVRRLNQAMFARAFDARDIIARHAETDAGELKSLLDALEQAAPEWAALRADVAAGLLRPDVDITPFVLDAMRLIGNARDLAGREGMGLGKAIAEMLDDIDLLDGAISPLTAALVRRFWKGGRAASTDDVAGFLKRYATEARKVASADAGLFGAAPGPAQILRAVDKDGFADLPDDLGAPRAADPAPPARIEGIRDEDFAQGAEAPEAEAADALLIDEMRADPVAAAEADAARALVADLGDIDIDLPDGTSLRASELLDDIEADRELSEIINLCNPARAA